MVDAPAFHEFLEIMTGKLRSTIGAEAERYTNFSEVMAEDADGVGGSSIAFTWDNNRPTGETVCDNEGGFSQESKKSRRRQTQRADRDSHRLKEVPAEGWAVAPGKAHRL